MINNFKITGNTYQTTDYSLFTRLDGNREIKNARVNKIKKSIETNGYIFNPIVVNEKYEVIDGQGRLEALKELGLPVDYVVCQGAGLLECIALNASLTSWSIKDYIESYCEMGIEDYILFNDLIHRFPELKLNTIGCISTGFASLPTKKIREGKIHIKKENLPQILSDLTVATHMAPLFSRVSGARDYYIYAAVFAVRSGADEDRLISTISKSVLAPAPNIRIALTELSDVYNKRLKDTSKRIYLYEAYSKFNCENFSWYEKKWGKLEVIT